MDVANILWMRSMSQYWWRTTGQVGDDEEPNCRGLQVILGLGINPGTADLDKGR